MFRPLVFAFALAIGSTAAFAPCPSGQYEMSVEGVSGVFCVASSPICIANSSTGACPTVQDGLPYGSYCGVVATGVYGCKTLDANSVKTYQPPGTTGPTMRPMSLDDPQPTTAPVPTAASAPATSPVPTTSSPLTPAPTDGSQCARNQYEMSVEGVRGIFCLSDGPICMAELGTGTCPGPQNGLPNGSHCGIVASGVYGCKPGMSDTTASPAPVPASSAPATTTVMPSSSTPPSTAPAPASTTSGPTTTPSPSTTTTTPATTTPIPSTASSPPVPVPTDGAQCRNGEYQMSVEGVPGIFCLSKGPICMADISAGTCPGPQYGLPNGSYCGRVASGVSGCKPNTTPAIVVAGPTATTTTPASTTSSPAATAPAPVTTTTAPSSAPSPVSSTGTCPNGGTPMSVEGIVPIFCVQEPACVADRATGNCPGSQDGLQWGSYCDIISRTGQYGCKPFNGTNIRNHAVYPAVRDCTGNAKGNMPVSVVGKSTYCAAKPVCAGSQYGNCPVAQDDLLHDAKCTYISAGVYGCVQTA